jgi:NitT/TauT family transport system permease protein
MRLHGHVIIASGSNVDTSLAFGAMVLLGVLTVGLFYALVGRERLLVPLARYEER